MSGKGLDHTIEEPRISDNTSEELATVLESGLVKKLMCHNERKAVNIFEIGIIDFCPFCGEEIDDTSNRWSYGR